MSYTEFAEQEAYRSKHAGSGLAVVIRNAKDPTDTVVGATTGIQPTDDFEKIPIEEAGESVVEEIVDGRHTGSMSIPAFWTPEWGDKLPTSQNHIGKEYVVLITVAEDREGAGTVVDAYTGCKITRVSPPYGARGARTLDIAFLFKRHYNGQEWANLTGTT